jgi:hypothetical protein
LPALLRLPMHMRPARGTVMEPTTGAIIGPMATADPMALMALTEPTMNPNTVGSLPIADRIRRCWPSVNDRSFGPLGERPKLCGLEIICHMRSRIKRGSLTHSCAVDLSVPRPPHSRIQPLLLLVPTRILGLYRLLDCLDLGTQRGYALRVLLLRGVQSPLRLVDRILPTCALLSPDRVLLGVLALATLPLPFVRFSRLPIRRLSGWARLLCIAGRLVDALLPPILAQVLRQFGVLAEGPVGSNGTLEDDTRLFHGRRDHGRVRALLGGTLVEEIAVGPPSLKRRLHRRRGDPLLEET